LKKLLVPVIASILILASVLSYPSQTQVYGEIIEVYLITDDLGVVRQVEPIQFTVALLDICPGEHLHAANGSYVIALDGTMIFEPLMGIDPPECGYGLTSDIPLVDFDTDPDPLECSAGEFDSGVECLPCPAGQYQPLPGQTSCIDADPGNFVPFPFSIEQTPCPAGQYQPDSGQTSCMNADPGNFVPNPGSTEQTPCPAGKISDTSGSTECTPCPAGKIPNEGQTECVTATPGLVTVPFLFQLFLEDAKQEITDAGLTVGVIISEYSNVPKGQVVVQGPAGGVQVEPGFPVTLRISLGEPEGVLKIGEGVLFVLHSGQTSPGIIALGGDLEIEEGATVTEDIICKKCGKVVINDADVGGDFICKDCQEVDIRNSGGSFGGKIIISGTTTVLIDNNHIAKDLKVKKSGTVTITNNVVKKIDVQSSQNVVIDGNTVSKDLKASKNENVSISNNSVSKKLDVKKNTVCFVSGNTVNGKIKIKDCE